MQGEARVIRCKYNDFQNGKQFKGKSAAQGTDLLSTTENSSAIHRIWQKTFNQVIKMGAAYKILGKTVQPHVLAISTFIATAAVTSYFTIKPKSRDETENTSPLNQTSDGKSSTANADGKDDDVMKSIEGFLNDLEKDAKQDTKAS